MASYQKFEVFQFDLHQGSHDFGAHTYIAALSSVAPVVTNGILSNLTEIVYTNISSRTLNVSGNAHVTGTYKATFDDLILTASGVVPEFRYVSIYNDTQTSPVKPLLCFFDRGVGNEVNLANLEQITLNFDDAQGLFQST